MPDTQERAIDEAGREMERTAGEMEQQGRGYDEAASEARQAQERVESDGTVPTAEAWDEDEEPAEHGDDPAGFDDPESLDLDDEDLEDDDGHPAEE